MGQWSESPKAACCSLKHIKLVKLTPENSTLIKVPKYTQSKNGIVATTAFANRYGNVYTELNTIHKLAVTVVHLIVVY